MSCLCGAINVAFHAHQIQWLVEEERNVCTIRHATDKANVVVLNQTTVLLSRDAGQHLAGRAGEGKAFIPKDRARRLSLLAVHRETGEAGCCLLVARRTGPVEGPTDGGVALAHQRGLVTAHATCCARGHSDAGGTADLHHIIKDRVSSHRCDEHLPSVG